ncbi:MULTISPECIES: single-stranded DNA-binding protein [Anaerostipes]|uniref:Single-stranded DNA-binding protein n=1 Tax=Anaerostipes hominis (ex Liu et al. 2021) TaxID=2763018 RepID=A0ABR7FPX2_9FIRM|nr:MULTISPECIES: single-stranded DNA-binding protein [Anaerostipes]MBC5677209.1 single-stranded DNA-binding protein [Anaerostipes hominis (ex Liu et al. 2021)]
MAKENYVILYGQVRQNPKVFISPKSGEYNGAVFQLKVLRRLRNRDAELRIDLPVILTKNPELSKQIADIRKGDMVEIRGVLTTSEVLKVSICPHCGAKNRKAGVNVHVTPIFINPQEKGQTDETGLELLKKKCEISNIFMGIGTLCREPDYHEHREEDSHRVIKTCAYQIAMNRKYFIREDPQDLKTDYPWIKSFGPLAEDDKDHLKMNTLIYISGSLQTRSFAKRAVCDQCEEDYEWNDVAMEIVPYNTEYLSDYIKAEKEE